MICLFCVNSLLEGFVRRYPTRIPMAKCTTATGRLPSSTSSCRLSSNCGNHLDCSPALFNAIAPPSPLMTGINSKCKKDNLQTIRFLFCQILSCSTWWNGMGSLGHWYLREMDPPPPDPMYLPLYFSFLSLIWLPCISQSYDIARHRTYSLSRPRRQNASKIPWVGVGVHFPYVSKIRELGANCRFRFWRFC